MSSDFPEPPPPPPPAEPASRRVAGCGFSGIGLAIAVAGATAGFIVTRAASPTRRTPPLREQAKPVAGASHRPSFGPRGGFGSACGGAFTGAGFGAPSFFGGGFCGGETGTVTKISGSTLTLRTLAGTRHGDHELVHDLQP